MSRDRCRLSRSLPDVLAQSRAFISGRSKVHGMVTYIHKYGGGDGGKSVGGNAGGCVCVCKTYMCNTIRDLHSSCDTPGQRPPQQTEMMAAYHRLITPYSTTRTNHTPHTRPYAMLSIFNLYLISHNFPAPYFYSLTPPHLLSLALIHSLLYPCFTNV